MRIKNIFEIKYKKLLLNCCILPLIILMAVCILCVGYGALNTQLTIEGTASAKLQKGIFIGNVSFNAEQSRNVNISENSYTTTGTFLSSNVKLTDNVDSRLVYDITICNNSNNDVGFREVIDALDNQLNINNNSNIEYLVSLNQGTILMRKDTMTFTLTFKYVDNVSLDTSIPNYNTVNSAMTFLFDQTYNVEYFFATGESEPPKKATLNNDFIVDFNENIRPDNIYVYMNGNELTINEDYTYNLGHLEVENVTGNLKITSYDNFAYGYRKVRYLQSNGKQYINTGVTGKSGLSGEIGFSPLANGDYTILGSRNGSTRIYLSHIYNYQTLGYGVFYQSNIFDTNYHVVKTSLMRGNQTMLIDDVLSINQTIATDIDTNLDMYAFALNYNDEAKYFSKIKLYYMKIYEYNETTNTNELVRDYIPVYNENTEEYGLYDLLNNQFYENLGTEEFYFREEENYYEGRVLTPPLPSEYEKINYIESTGTQYIDTGIIAKTGLSSEIYARMISGGDVSLSGARATKNGIISGIDKRFYLLHYYNAYTIGYDHYYTSARKDLEYHKFNSVLKNGTQTLKIDDELIINMSQKINVNTGSSVFIFGANNGYNTLIQASSFRLYNMKLWEENASGVDVLVREFVPCYRKSDHEYGLYDLVTNTFYENQGTGEFIGN